MPSIRLRLLKWLIGPILVLNLAGGALIYALAWIPAQHAFDQNLSDAAAGLGARLLLRQGGLQLDLPPRAEQVLRSDGDDEVFFAVRSPQGRLIAGDADLPAAPGPRAAAWDGSMRGEAVRVAALVDASQATVTVAKTVRKRSQARQAIVRALVLLETLFALAAVGLIWFSVSSGLRPLNRVRAVLAARGADDLSPLPPAGVPYELEPVAQALNGLLDRIDGGARAQQDFLANVAHQLRTPLAGLHAQLDVLAQRHRDPETTHALAMMRASAERMIRQTNQLLALARAEPSHFAKTRLEPLPLDRLLADTVQHFVDQAARKQIDLGFELEPAVVNADPFLLRDLVDNLIDNAIRYTPENGAVTVACRQTPAGALLTVEDSGPGIPPGRREAVFSRFVRLDDKTTGSGLGLAIVRDIAHAHGATVSIDSPASGQGALFSVQFPV
jgi:two-component system sensor histidine kinase TctE